MEARLTLERVHHAPDVLSPGILYYSEAFTTAIHLCPCGCHTEVVTPTGSGGWVFKDDPGGPTLTPSVGNWQIQCRSHYWITAGEVVWA
jgi:hypothetical protein